MNKEENKLTNGKKWVGLDEPMGDCECCIHQDECALLKQHALSHLNGKYRFRCPILIEVDENIEYGKEKEEEIPELPLEKTEELINERKKFTEVRLKTIRKAWNEE